MRALIISFVINFVVIPLISFLSFFCIIIALRLIDQHLGRVTNPREIKFLNAVRRFVNKYLRWLPGQ